MSARYHGAMPTPFGPVRWVSLLAALFAPVLCCCAMGGPVGEKAAALSEPASCHQEDHADRPSSGGSEHDNCECQAVVGIAPDAPVGGGVVEPVQVAGIAMGMPAAGQVLVDVDADGRVFMSDREPPPDSGRRRCVLHNVFLC